MEPVYDIPVSRSQLMAMVADAPPNTVVLFRTVRDGAGKRAEYALSRGRRFARGWKRMGRASDMVTGEADG